MCLMHTPGAPPPPPPPQYLHNPFLDGASFGMGTNKGRNALMTQGLNAPGTGTMPTAPTPKTTIAQRVASGVSPNNGALVLPAGSGVSGPVVPMIAGQPGSVVPTVGGAMAGTMGGRITSPTAPPPGALNQRRG